MQLCYRAELDAQVTFAHIPSIAQFLFTVLNSTPSSSSPIPMDPVDHSAWSPLAISLAPTGPNAPFNGFYR